MINPFASSPKYGTIYGNTKSQAPEGHLANVHGIWRSEAEPYGTGTQRAKRPKGIYQTI